jgi:hypothetical protein
METVKIGSLNDIKAPPQDQPPISGLDATGKAIKPAAAPAALHGTISDADAIKATDGSKFNTLLTPLQGGASQSGTAGNSVPVSGLIDGALAVELVDAILPALLVVALHVVKMDIKKTQLQLTAKEKGTLTPLVKACMDQLMINFNSPWAALGVSMLVIYGAKVGEFGLVQVLDRKAEKQREEKGEAPVINIKQNEPLMQDRPKVNPAPVVKINPAPAWEPSEEQIFVANKLIGHKGRARAIFRLKKEQAAGTLEKFLASKPRKR